MTDFNTPKEWLQNVYETRKMKNSLYSMRAFARDIQISQTLISFIWNDKRPLTLKQAKKVQENLMLEGNLEELFVKKLH